MYKLLAATVITILPLLANACPAWLSQPVQQLRSEKQLNLCELTKDKVVLIVNTASKCGFTNQFADLEKLYQQYNTQDFVIIGFPSDSFMQEHDDSEAIADVCYVNYGVTFPMAESSAVRGKNANAVFVHLNETLGAPSWNFNKYLINREGVAIEKFGSRTAPLDKELTNAIEKLLARAP